MNFLKEREYYKKKINEMLEKIENVEFLKRIYNLIEYLYIYGKRE